MSLSYAKLSKKWLSFRRLSGVDIKEFNQITEAIRTEWSVSIENNKQCAGRNSKLSTLEDKLLALMIYYRTYTTHEFIGYLFNLHNSNICRLFKKLEPILAKKITIKKDRSLTAEKVLELLVDVTEQPTQRPKKASKQRKSYSGKKKRNTLKTEIVVTDKGAITSVSRMHMGRIHDFKIRKQSEHLPPTANKYVDSGYQGLQKITCNVTLPYKKSKGNPLTQEQKSHNRTLASFRMRIEHKIRQIKIFKIMAETYRNFQKKHNMRFNIIAGIVNLKCGF